MKPLAGCVDVRKIRRPFTGAWIETKKMKRITQVHVVAPSRGRGLKLAYQALAWEVGASPLHGGVD